jgi:hypothetical protein
VKEKGSYFLCQKQRFLFGAIFKKQFEKEKACGIAEVA